MYRDSNSGLSSNECRHSEKNTRKKLFIGALHIPFGGGFPLFSLDFEYATLFVRIGVAGFVRLFVLGSSHSSQASLLFIVIIFI